MENLLAKKEKIKSDLAKNREELLNFISSLSEEQLQVKMNQDNESWNILEVIKHLYSAETGMLQLMQGIQKGGSGVPEDFDLNRYNQSRVRKVSENNLSTLTEMLNKSRRELLEFLSSLDENDFEKKGRHAIGKILSIEQIFGVISSHEYNHLQKCKSVL